MEIKEKNIMKCEVGDIFGIDDDYSERAKFCNENGLIIKEINQSETGERQFQIQENPKPTIEEILHNLRCRREFECFSIINRGQLWYETLNDEQKEKLNIWYQEWLDITEKYVDNVTIDEIIPLRPVWLK